MESSECKSPRRLSGYLDEGEASALALGLENPNSLLILDDLKGRKEAERLKLRFTGTLGVLIKAKLEKHKPDAAPYFESLRSNGFRISDTLLDLAIRQANP